MPVTVASRWAREWCQMDAERWSTAEIEEEVPRFRQQRAAEAAEGEIVYHEWENLLLGMEEAFCEYSQMLMAQTGAVMSDWSPEDPERITTLAILQDALEAFYINRHKRLLDIRQRAADARVAKK